jgi:hypothetical protein
MNPPRAVVIAVLALLLALTCRPADIRGQRKHQPRRPAQVVKVVKQRGFSWRDAGIGAAAVGFGVSVVAGGLLLVRAQRPRATTK